MIGCGVLYILASSACTAEPSIALISSLNFWASCKSAGSFIVSMNESCRIFTRSAGTPSGQHIGPAHQQRRHRQLDLLTIFLGLGEIEEQRYVRQIGMFFECNLHDDCNFVVAEIFRVSRS